MGNWHDISEADTREDDIDKLAEDRKKKLGKMIKKVVIDEEDRILSNHLIEVLSLDVIAYRIFPYFYFSNNLFFETDFLDFFGKFNCDGQRRIYQIFFFFYVKLHSDFHRFPPRDLIGIKCWNIFDTLPKEYLRKMRRVEVIHSTSRDDLVLDEESVQIVSNSITNLKFCSRNNTVFRSLVKCRKLRVLDVYMNGASGIDGMNKLEVECTDLRTLRIFGHKYGQSIFPLNKLKVLKRIELKDVLFTNESECLESLKDFSFLKEVLFDDCVFFPTINIFSIFSSASIEIIDLKYVKFNVVFSGSVDISKESKLKKISFCGLEDNSKSPPAFGVQSNTELPVASKKIFEQILERCSQLERLYVHSGRVSRTNRTYYAPPNPANPQLIRYESWYDVMNKLRGRDVSVSFHT